MAMPTPVNLILTSPELPRFWENRDRWVVGRTGCRTRAHWMSGVRRRTVGWWVCVLLVLAVLGYSMWRAATHAKSIEDDTRYLFESRGHSQYGAKFLSILAGRGRS